MTISMAPPSASCRTTISRNECRSPAPNLPEHMLKLLSAVRSDRAVCFSGMTTTPWNRFSCCGSRAVNRVFTMPHVLEHSHTREAIHDRLGQGPHVSYLRDWIYGGIDGTVTTLANARRSGKFSKRRDLQVMTLPTL